MSKRFWLLVTAALFGACVAQTSDDRGAVEHVSRSDQGLTSFYTYSYSFNRWSWSLVGIGLNGRALNGTVLSEHGLLGLEFSSARGADHDKLTTVTLSGTAFSGTSGKTKLSARDFVGVRFDGILDDGRRVPMRIDDVQQDKRSSDVYRYAVSYETTDGWVPFCGSRADGSRVLALPLAGRWDYRQGVTGGGAHIEDAEHFTFACEGFVLAKCVDMGYAPWRQGRVCTRPGACTTITLADHHQACSRAMRADYCGDGQSYTQDGTLIELYDGIGMHTDGEDWAFEAEWVAGGARCVAQERIESDVVPPCWDALITSDCGALSHFESGTLLMTEAP